MPAGLPPATRPVGAGLYQSGRDQLEPNPPRPACRPVAHEAMQPWRTTLKPTRQRFELLSCKVSDAAEGVNISLKSFLRQLGEDDWRYRARSSRLRFLFCSSSNDRSQRCGDNRAFG